MSVSVSGAVLAALLYEHANCNGDQEGFLLGKVMNHVTDTISDSPMINRKEETVTYVYNYIPSCSPFSWYDHAGRVNNEKLKTVLKDHKPHEVIGWYRWRRQSTLCPSLREKAMHRALMTAFPGVDNQHFLFSLFSCSATSNLSTHSFDYIFQYQSDKSFLRLPVTVVNLKDTSQADYKLQGNHNINAIDGLYADTLRRASPSFMDVNSSRLHQVKAIHDLNNELHNELKELYGMVSSSEEAVGSLATEVEHLRERWKQKRYPLHPIQKDIKQRPKRQAAATGQSSTATLETPNVVAGLHGAAKKSASVVPEKVTRQQSKQEEIMEDLKDLILTPTPAAAATTSTTSTTPMSMNTTKSEKAVNKKSEHLETPTGPLLSEPESTPGLRRSASPTLSNYCSDTSAKSETSNVTVEALSGSPATARRERIQKNNTEEVKKPKKKAEPFDFVNNLMQDVKSTASLKRNGVANTNVRKTRAQSMIVEGVSGAKDGNTKRRSVTPTREPAHKPNNATGDKNIKAKSSTLPSNMGSPPYESSADDDLPSSPTY